MVKSFEDGGEAVTADMGIIFIAAFFALLSSVALLVELLPRTCGLSTGRVAMRHAPPPQHPAAEAEATVEWARIQAAACNIESA